MARIAYSLQPEEKNENMSQNKQSVRDIFLGALSRKANNAKPIEIRQFILDAARENLYDVTTVGDLDEFTIRFSSGQTISFDGDELRYDK